jgi:hypothetical protein
MRLPAEAASGSAYKALNWGFVGSAKAAGFLLSSGRSFESCLARSARRALTCAYNSLLSQGQSADTYLSSAGLGPLPRGR